MSPPPQVTCTANLLDQVHATCGRLKHRLWKWLWMQQHWIRIFKMVGRVSFSPHRVIIFYSSIQRMELSGCCWPLIPRLVMESSHFPLQDFGQAESVGIEDLCLVGWSWCSSSNNPKSSLELILRQKHFIYHAFSLAVPVLESCWPWRHLALLSSRVMRPEKFPVGDLREITRLK